jgi:hypothetical protein
MVSEEDVADATRRDLEEIAKRDPALARSTLAMSALCLAREMDSSGNSATSKSMCAKTLLDTMARLVELAPPAATKDGIDELKQRRDGRRRGSPRAKAQKRS